MFWKYVLVAVDTLGKSDMFKNNSWYDNDEKDLSPKLVAI
jgi:hypothetical protein